MKSLLCLTVLAAGSPAAITIPDEFAKSRAFAGTSSSDIWLGLRTHYDGAQFKVLDSDAICGAAPCRHVGYAGAGLLALDNAGVGIELASLEGVQKTLPFPIDDPAQSYVLGGNNDIFVVGTTTGDTGRVFQRDGDGWKELPALDAPLRSIDVHADGLIVATRDFNRQVSPLVDGKWLDYGIADTETNTGGAELATFTKTGALV